MINLIIDVFEYIKANVHDKIQMKIYHIKVDNVKMNCSIATGVLIKNIK